MTELGAQLTEILTTAASGRGVASVSVIERAGAQPQTCWVPAAADEPAFLAYSITKTFTAALILKLCEEGRLSLDDPLAKWFPRIAQAARISLRQLLNHTAGIPDYGGSSAYHESLRASPSIPWSFEQFAAETFGKGLEFAPGQGWEYSNPGYMLVKRIAEEVTGTPYRALVLERIVGPFGLRRTFVAESIDDLASLAPAWSSLLSVDGAPRDVRAHYHPGWVSHGVVASTASEIVCFFDGLFQGQFLARHSLNQMMELVPLPVLPGSESAAQDSPLRPGKASYGLGLMGDPESSWGLTVGHNGGGPGYSASAFHAFDLGGVSVCAMGAIEEDLNVVEIVASILDYLMIGGPSPPAL